MLRHALAALCACVSLVAQAMAPAPAAALDIEAAADLLIPQGMIVGGFPASLTRPPGFGPDRALRGGFVKFVFPSALAANGLDLLVVDNGLGALLRVDTVAHSVARLARLPNIPGSRVAAGRDGTIYLLRPERADVLRFTREGQPLPAFAARYEILRPADLVIEPGMNRLWIADSAGGVFAFHPTGRMGQPVVGRGDGFALPDEGATVLAAGDQGVIGIDKRCTCLLVFDSDGQVLGRFGEGDIVNPIALAVDQYGRSWVVDHGDRTLKVFSEGVLTFSVPAERLGLSDVTAIAIDHQRVYLADGPGGKIGVFAMLPPRSTP